MADRKISDLTALTTPATGDLLPIVDVSEAAAADKNKKITVQELFKGVPDGTASAPGLAFESDDGNGIYLAGTDTVGIATGGAQRVTVNASGDVSISGNLTVSGTTTTIDSTTLTVDDKNIELGSVASPSDTTADGGGITLKGASDKTLTWVQSTGMWTSNQPFDVAGEVQCDSLDVDGAADISGNVTLHGNLDLQDNDVLHLGDSNDLQIYHNGSGSYIDDAGTGDLRIRANNLSLQKYTGENYFVGTADGAAYLYYDAAEKLNTTSGGINVTGSVTCDSLTCDGTFDVNGGNVAVTRTSGQLTTAFTATASNSVVEIGGSTGAYLDLKSPDSDDFDLRLGSTGTGGFIQVASGNLAITGSVVPGADDSYDLGTSSLQWQDAYFDGTIFCDGITSDGAATIQGAAGQVIIKDSNSSATSALAELLFQDSNGTNLGYTGYVSSSDSVYSMLNRQNEQIRFGTNNTWRCLISATGHFQPYTTNASDLGTASAEWRDAYFDGTVFTDGLEVTATANLSSKVYSTERTATASSFDLATGNFWTFGAIAVPNPANQTAGMMGSLRVTAAPTSFASNWKFPGGSYTAPTSFPAVAPFYVQASGTILVGSWTEGIA